MAASLNLFNFLNKIRENIDKNIGVNKKCVQQIQFAI